MRALEQICREQEVARDAMNAMLMTNVAGKTLEERVELNVKAAKAEVDFARLSNERSAAIRELSRVEPSLTLPATQTQLE